jgi:hypothetical protein
VESIGEVGLAQSGSLLHTFVSTMPTPSGQKLYHTIRQTSGAWLPFRDVEAVAGEVGRIDAFSVSAA